MAKNKSSWDTVVVAVISAISGIAVAWVNKPKTNPSPSDVPSVASPIPSLSSTPTIVSSPSSGTGVVLSPNNNARQNIKAGIIGNNNSNNKVDITENQNITINNQSKGIYETRIVPKNILTKLYPGVSIKYAKLLLGEANIVTEASVHIWHFDNASIHIASDDNQSIDAISLVKASMEQPDEFTVYPFNYLLGTLKRDDLKDYGCSPVKEDHSFKDYGVYTKCFFGNPGNYWKFEFGIYRGGRIAYANPNHTIDISSEPFNIVCISRNNSTIRIYQGNMH